MKTTNSRKIKKIEREIVRELKLEKLADTYIQRVMDNDIALYNYIDQLAVSREVGKNPKNIEVFVSANTAPYGTKVEKDGRVSKFTGSTEIIKLVKVPNVYYESKEGTKKIVLPWSPKGFFTFDVTIYGSGQFGDGTLANEAGDIMYYMEYNEISINEENPYAKQRTHVRAGDPSKEEEYLDTGAGGYSNRVESTYKERRENGEGKDPDNDPYPLSLKK